MVHMTIEMVYVHWLSNHAFTGAEMHVQRTCRRICIVMKIAFRQQQSAASPRGSIGSAFPYQADGRGFKSQLASIAILLVSHFVLKCIHVMQNTSFQFLFKQSRLLILINYLSTIGDMFIIYSVY
jgi:hypothetical protein